MTFIDNEIFDEYIKIINPTTKIIHYTNNNAFIFVPKKIQK